MTSNMTTSNHHATRPPLIGITADVLIAPNARPKAGQALTYSEAVAKAGGLPVLLPPIVELAEQHARAVDAVVFTGGDDIDLTPFGLSNHPASSLMHPQRQQYEFALLRALDALPRTPVLGICLGMQFMALHGRGSLNPHLPDTHPTASDHRSDNAHPVAPLNGITSSDLATNHPLKPVLFVEGASPRRVASNHHQAVSNPGSLRALAISPDNVLEALDNPRRPFYIGVQWHPERTSDPIAGDGVFRALVNAARTT
ncbi:MAG: gamma-glutamyl-gamma-aminobutyrate hydrolase family protein [Phycisphaerales bacterium]|nr:gamma-glutamyl-gamma-aminobutyrate hydrolase family protein [Phycisphaerales bacterium]